MSNRALHFRQFAYRRWLALSVAALVFAGFSTSAATTGVDDFAWAFDIESHDSGDIVQVRLPLSVYQSVSDEQLRDIAVFDATGQALTRVLKSPPRKTDSNETEYSLVVLPLSAGQAQSADEVRLLFERMGADVRLELGESGNGTDAVSPMSYLLDTSAIKRNLHELNVTWSPVTENFVGRLDVEGSNDLDRWSNVGGASIAWLERGASVVRRGRIPLRSAKFDYLRVTVRDVPDAWQLATVQAIHRDNLKPEPTAEFAQVASTRDSKDGGWLFDLGGYPPVEQVQLVPTAGNTILSGRLLARSEPGDSWRLINKGSFYRLGLDDTALLSSTSYQHQSRLRYWKFIPESGNLDAPVELRLRWRSESLYFLASSNPPYTLVAGRADEAQEGFPMKQQFANASILKRVTEKSPATLATLSLRRAAGGADRLTPTFGSGAAWRVWLLWGGLILGVLVVGIMAVRLVRDLKSSAD